MAAVKGERVRDERFVGFSEADIKAVVVAVNWLAAGRARSTLAS